MHATAKAARRRKAAPALHPKEPADLLRKAIEATPDPLNPQRAIPASRFATDKLGQNDRTVRRYLERTRPVPGPVLAICRQILGITE